MTLSPEERLDEIRDWVISRIGECDRTEKRMAMLRNESFDECATAEMIRAQVERRTLRAVLRMIESDNSQEMGASDTHGNSGQKGLR